MNGSGFTFIKSDLLYNFSIGLEAKGLIQDARLILYYAHDINSEDLNINFRLMTLEIMTKRHDRAGKIFEKLYSSKWDKNPQLWDILLYLFSFSYQFSEPLLSRALSITFEDLKIKEDSNNDIVYNIIKQRWPHALMLFKQTTNRVDEDTRRLVENLMEQANHLKKYQYYLFNVYLEQLDFLGMYKLINKENKRRKITSREYKILVLSRNICRIIYEDFFPTVIKQEKTSYLNIAFSNRDFRQAREIINQFGEKKELIIARLLDILVDLMDQKEKDPTSTLPYIIRPKKTDLPAKQ